MSERRGALKGVSAKVMTAFFLVLASSSGSAQNERWFTFEVSVFSNELASDRAQELPIARADAALENAPTISLTQFFDLLNLAQWADGAAEDNQAAANSLAGNMPVLRPLAEGGKSYKFVDLARDPLIELSSSESDFQQTNRALERSPDYRLLTHAVWRQPLTDEGKSVPIKLSGGMQRGGTSELEGTIDLHFNARRDRIVVDTNFILEASLAGDLAYQHKQSRELRSGEFHYLDSPAIGVIILAQPYEVPPPDSEEASARLDDLSN